MKRLVFMDFEASALRQGYPIEVGWAWAERAHVEARSLLIAPSDEWLSPRFRWDPVAESIHGIDLNKLCGDGRSADAVCRKLNGALTDAEVCFDTGPTGIDRRWLEQLYSSTDVAAHLNFATIAADTLTINTAQRLGIGDVAWTLIEKLAPALPHAAAEDAAHWAWWQIAIERVAGAGYGGISDQSDRGKEVLSSVVGNIAIRSTGRQRHAAEATT